MKTVTMRDFVAIAFRRQRLILISFFCLCGLAIVLVSLVPNTYDAEMKILVKQNRVDPPVTPDQGQTQRVGNLTQQDLESEAELLRSRDVLEGAVAQCTMPKPPPDLWSFVPVVNAFAAPPAPKAATDLLLVTKAARDLAEKSATASGHSGDRLNSTSRRRNFTTGDHRVMTPADIVELRREEENKLIDYTFLTSGTAPKSITFTSPERHTGCSWLLSRVAQRLAERVAESVCAVDANLHWPALLLIAV